MDKKSLMETRQALACGLIAVVLAYLQPARTPTEEAANTLTVGANGQGQRIPGQRKGYAKPTRRIKSTALQILTDSPLSKLPVPRGGSEKERQQPVK